MRKANSKGGKPARPKLSPDHSRLSCQDSTDSYHTLFSEGEPLYHAPSSDCCATTDMVSPMSDEHNHRSHDGTPHWGRGSVEGSSALVSEALSQPGLGEASSRASLATLRPILSGMYAKSMALPGSLPSSPPGAQRSAVHMALTIARYPSDLPSPVRPSSNARAWCLALTNSLHR